METFKRLENEDENAYIWRVCDNKDLIGTWQDICDLLNSELNHQYNESWYRKMYQSFMMVFDSIKDKYLNDEQIKKIEEKKQELIKERCRLSDERVAYNKALRNDARLEQRLDKLESAIMNFGKENYIPNPIKEIKSDNDLLVILSDLHIGQAFDSFCGKYNIEIAKQRMCKYLDEIISLQKMYNSENCFVSLQGDLISNSIHKTIAITNQENVIQQIKKASELVTMFINELSHHFNKVVVVIAIKFFYIKLSMIIWYSKAALNNVKNVEFKMNNIDNTFSVLEIRGKTYIGVHGDYDAFSKMGIANLSMMLGFFPYAITFGHLHTCSMQDESGVKLIRGGSLAGSGDDYTIQKRLTGKATQMVCVCTSDGIKSYNVIELS